MKKIFFILTLLTILILPSVISDDINISLNQSEYYFLTGQDSILNLESQAKEETSGMLTYTVTQNINNQGMMYQNKETKSTTFKFPKGDNNIALSFGTSEQPLTLTLDMSFDTEKEKITIPQIKIHFVENQNQTKNQENQQQSSSENKEKSKQEKQKTKSSKPKESNLPKKQQKLQNHQLSQDSSALKKEMQKEMQKKAEMEKQFQESLSKNKQFQKEHQELLKKGYNITNKEINPTNNNSGDFKLEYQNQKGEKTELKGEMENGNITKMSKKSDAYKKDMLNSLKNNTKYQELDKKLKKEGFKEGNITYNPESLELKYKKENQTATIKATFKNETITKVELEKEKNYWWWLLLLLLPLLLLFKKKKKEEFNQPSKPKKIFDYKKESKKILERAKTEYKKGNKKEGYSLANSALRLYLAYRNNLEKELTNDELINSLKTKKLPWKEIKEICNKCEMIEFAKGKDKEFEITIEKIKKIIY